MTDGESESFEAEVRAGLHRAAQRYLRPSDIPARVIRAEQHLACVRRVRSMTVATAAVCSVALVVGLVAGSGGTPSQTTLPPSSVAKDPAVVFLGPKGTGVSSLTCLTARKCLATLVSNDPPANDYSSQMLVSTDGGASWKREPLRLNLGKLRVTLLSSLTCESTTFCAAVLMYVPQSDSGMIPRYRLLQSDDAGASWHTSALPDGGLGPPELSCTGPQHCVVIFCLSGAVYTSIDGGSSWKAVSRSAGLAEVETLASVWCGRGGLCVIGSADLRQAIVYISTNYGSNWHREVVAGNPAAARNPTADDVSVVGAWCDGSSQKARCFALASWGSGHNGGVEVIDSKGPALGPWRVSYLAAGRTTSYGVAGTKCGLSSTGVCLVAFGTFQGGGSFLLRAEIGGTLTWTRQSLVTGKQLATATCVPATVPYCLMGGDTALAASGNALILRANASTGT